jgi:hypothetical protein
MSGKYRVVILIFCILALFALYAMYPFLVRGEFQVFALAGLFATMIIVGIGYVFSSVEMLDNEVNSYFYGVKTTALLREVSEVKIRRTFRMGHTRYSFYDQSGKCKLSYLDYYDSSSVLKEILLKNNITINPAQSGW